MADERPTRFVLTSGPEPPDPASCEPVVAAGLPEGWEEIRMIAGGQPGPAGYVSYFGWWWGGEAATEVIIHRLGPQCIGGRSIWDLSPG